MLEAFGILTVSLTILAYFGTDSDKASGPKQLFLGLAITVTFFVKSNYGILLALTIAVAILFDSRFRLRALLTRANLLISLPMLVIFPI